VAVVLLELRAALVAAELEGPSACFDRDRVGIELLAADDAGVQRIDHLDGVGGLVLRWFLGLGRRRVLGWEETGEQQRADEEGSRFHGVRSCDNETSMEGSRVAERKGALVRSSRGTVALAVAAHCCVHPGAPAGVAFTRGVDATIGG
jgi:hypothetical protein